MLAVGIYAQPNGQQQKFSPEKFDQELKEFITTEAKLTSQEAAKFFPVYKEMQAKQRGLFERQRSIGKANPQDETSCLKAIRERDEMELEMKRILQTYHNRFLEMLPASKVYAIIQAEDRFHRRMMKRWSNNRPPQMDMNQRPQKPQK
jgi:hypothetical protein